MEKSGPVRRRALRCSPSLTSLMHVLAHVQSVSGSFAPLLKSTSYFEVFLWS